MPAYGVSFTAYYRAYDTSANAYKTGDSANHSLRWTKDGTGAATTNSAAEVDATNDPGLYKVTITATEAQCLAGQIGGKSSTADIILIPNTYDFLKLPNVAAGSNGGLPTVDANNYVAGIQGTKNQLDDLNDIDGTSVTATTVSDKTGYSLTQTFPTNFADLAITATTGRVTVGTNSDKTGYSISGTKTTLDALNDIAASDILTTALTEAYAANGTAPTLTQAVLAIHQMLMAFAISGTTYQVKKLDGTTNAFAGTLDDGTSPTSLIRS